jgi:hypothetical protein
MSPSATADLDQQRECDLCGLMAELDVRPLQHSVFRSLLYLGCQNNRETAVECSFAWLGERGGRDGKRARRERDENRGIDDAFHQLRTVGWLKAEPRPTGRGYIYSVLLTAAFSAARVPEWPYAATAVKRLSLQVSPIGPTRERSYCELAWALDRDGQRTASQQQWAMHLKLSRSRAIFHLKDLAAADIGVTVEVLPPAAPPPGTKRRGRPAQLYRVRATLPPRGHRPDGAARHRAREAQVAEMVRELTAKSSPAGPGGYADGPDGTMVWLPADRQDYELPWHDDPEDDPRPTADEGRAPNIVEGTVREGANPKTELACMSERVWHKELLGRAMELAELQLKAGRKLSESRRLDNFVRPLLALQDKYGNPPLLKYALEQTIEGPALHQPDTRGWVKYLGKVCENNSARFTGAGPPPGTNASVKASHSPERLREHLRALLRQAYDHNKRNETEAALTLLWRMLAAVSVLAPALYAGDIALARASIIESFKRGSGYELTDEQKGPTAFLDYLPQAAWPHRAPLEDELAGVSAVTATNKLTHDPGTHSLPTAAHISFKAALDRFPSQPMFDL